MKKIIFYLKRILLLVVFPVFRFLSLLNRQKRPQARVIFFSGKLGDLVCLSSIFKNLKHNYPEEKTILVAKSPFVEILANNPFLDQMVVFGSDKEPREFRWLLKQWYFLRKFKISAYFNLNNNFEGNILGLYLLAKERITLSFAHEGLFQKLVNIFYQRDFFHYDMRIKDFYLKMLEKRGAAIIDNRNQLYFNGPTPAEVEEYFQKESINPNDLVIGVSVTSGKEFKRWPDGHWIKLVQSLIEKYQAKVIFFGTSGEVSKIEEIRKGVARKTFAVINPPLEVLPHYLKKCRLFVSVDMGVNYISDALGVPTINIMGTCDKVTQAPENNCHLVTNPEFCRPFMKTPAEPHYPKFKEEIEKCYQLITPEQVLPVCEKILDI